MKKMKILKNFREKLKDLFITNYSIFIKLYPIQCMIEDKSEYDIDNIIDAQIQECNDIIEDNKYIILFLKTLKEEAQENG